VGPQDNLTALVAAASSDDKLVLADGTYLGSGVNVLSIYTNLTICALNVGGAVIDGEHERRIIQLLADCSVTLVGLRMTRGRALAGSYSALSSSTDFPEGDALCGGGILAEPRSALVMAQCTIDHTFAVTVAFPVYGTAIYLSAGATATLVDCTIAHVSGVSHSEVVRGVVLYASEDTSTALTNTMIINASATVLAKCDDARCDVRYGGWPAEGFYRGMLTIDSRSALNLTNTTITQINVTSVAGSVWGTVVSLYLNATAQITNTVISDVVMSLSSPPPPTAIFQGIPVEMCGGVMRLSEDAVVTVRNSSITNVHSWARAFIVQGCDCPTNNARCVAA
jgi:hypothetical protein